MRLMLSSRMMRRRRGASGSSGQGSAPSNHSSSNRYRNEQPTLFQGLNRRMDAARLPPPGIDRVLTLGPNEYHIDEQTGWPWANRFGDWTNALGVAQSSANPWATVSTPTQPAGTLAAYSMDVTALLQHVQANNQYAAFRLTYTNGQRELKGVLSTTPPSISVTYTDATTATLPCFITARAQVNTPDAGSDLMIPPVFMEFERPAKAVQSASMSFTVKHSTTATSNVVLFLLTPNFNSDPVQQGIAANYSNFDVGLSADPSVIGMHRYLDGLPESDFFMDLDPLDDNNNVLAERNWDPVIHGRSATHDFTKYPHRGAGKWISSSALRSRASIIPSSYSNNGFVPLHAGLGALRLNMPKECFADGENVGYGGTGGSNLELMMPEPVLGTMPAIYVRYYFRLGADGYPPGPDSMFHVYKDLPPTPACEWVNQSGKFGIQPGHITSDGGTSARAGEGYGWQMRLSWTDTDGGVNGPNDRGLAAGFHLYDFGGIIPPSHPEWNYSGWTGDKTQWGQRGGKGGILYPGHWYCLETYLKLNTLDPTNTNGGVLGALSDGELRAWVDGVLVYEKTGLRFRTTPRTLTYDPAQFRPARDLGVRNLWLNWYHGGVTENARERNQFYTGLVYGTQYIGPMKGI